ncbi:hypothetical protein PLICRDRAFT_152327 [Plicaturopsis crispa FD-325 SS-3]|nr:hypothetical protein PLICRDRAFT_152327 [Plicaturopsis crispa FD-325 SS-3]
MNLHNLNLSTPTLSGITATNTPRNGTRTPKNGVETPSTAKDLEKYGHDHHRRLNDALQRLVSLDPDEDPQNKSTLRKWIIVTVICSAALCVACASSIATFTENPMAADFHVSKEATILGISMYIEGLGVGPLLIGPLSEMYGRTIVYRVSYTLLFIFSWPVTFAPNLAVYLIFRFLTGFCGSAFLSVAGSSISDLFTDATVGNAMAVYTVFPFLGPAIGPLLSGFICQNLNWRWAFRFQIIWIFVELVALFLFVPETYVPVILKFKAQRLRESTGNENYIAPLETRHANDRSLGARILTSCYRPFELMVLDRMALLLNIWNALALGILYLTFQAFPIIFENGHGFSVQQTGMSFLGIAIGMIIALCTQPIWNKIYKNAGPNPPPETRLYMGQVGGILIPVGLFWIAFTTYPSVPWIVPIIASVPFGAGVLFIFTSTFTFLVTAYRPIAASAMASNSVMRSTFAAVFPLFAPYMYKRLGAPGATALLAGLATLMAPLPFIFFRIGARLRERSRFGAA